MRHGEISVHHFAINNHQRVIMCRVLLLTVLSLVAATHQAHPAKNQLPIFKDNSKGPIGILHSSSGAPIASNYTVSTLNKNLNTNPYFMDTVTHFIRENIPERIVHMKGAGAFGYFVTTHDVSNICATNFLNKVGKKTPIAVRFSVGVTGKGGPDTSATPMGFAAKFYTEEGNLDLLGLNFPLFVLKDPLRLPNFIHVLKRNPATNMADVNMVWDYATQHPESLFMFLMLYGDRGIPYSYRHMPGYPVHTFQVYNANGTSSFIRFHMIPTAGLKYMNLTTAASTACSTPDYYTSDLYTSIAKGNYPKWNVSIQIMSEENVKSLPFDAFDTSKIIPEDLFPLHPVGQMVLNRNPKNYFAEIEQLAFNPSNLVRGILGAPDKVFEARLMFYKQAQSYRLGVNYGDIPVNCPYRSKVLNYNRDGVPPVSDNGEDAPNYYPNSFNGPEPYVDENLPTLLEIHQDEPNNFEQAREYYTKYMSKGERNRFVQTISGTLCYTADYVQDRAVTAFGKIHSDLGKLVAKVLKQKNC